tara:strand:+ start:198513 stop:199763 length:1251 start_codon:yes stop_codon:yes gene_type:complete
MILHVDGDAFFAMCEVSRRPDLRGKPVVTGRERGIVTAATYEAKALGISRATPIHEVRSKYPEVTILPSDYELYAQVSKRMYAITRRYTPFVEEYGTDECFASLTHLTKPLEAARNIKEELQQELNMTFSLGMGPTKVLAKLASKHKKPDGFWVITPENREECLAQTSVSNVWGLGPKTCEQLQRKGIQTALDFAQLPREWVVSEFNAPILSLWEELRGVSVLPVDALNSTDQKSIQRTRSFTPHTTDAGMLFSELSQHVEHGCKKARRLGVVATHVSFFLKTQAFALHTATITLPTATSNPSDIVPLLRTKFLEVYRKQTLYRTTGITLQGLKTKDTVQQDLFGTHQAGEKGSRLMLAIDALERKFGEHTLYLGTSARTITHDRALPFASFMHEDALVQTSTGAKRFPIPYMGTV